MTRFPIAFLMLALIGNPACCCATGATDTPGGVVEPTSACCQEMGNEGTGREPEAPAPCPCAKRLCLLSGKKEAVPVPLLLLGTADLSPLSPDAIGPRAPLSRQAMVRLSDAIPPEAPPFRLLYGVFRC